MINEICHNVSTTLMAMQYLVYTMTVLQHKNTNKSTSYHSSKDTLTTSTAPPIIHQRQLHTHNLTTRLKESPNLLFRRPPWQSTNVDLDSSLFIGGPDVLTLVVSSFGGFFVVGDGFGLAFFGGYSFVAVVVCVCDC